MSNNSHYQNILNLRREQAQVDAEIAERKKFRCVIRRLLLSEVKAKKAEDAAAKPPCQIDPGEEMYRARENWGVSDA